MTSAFIDTSKVAVTVDEDTIYVRRKMDFGTKNLVGDTIARIQLRDGAVDTVIVTNGAYNFALMTHNIVGWEGPAFANGNGKPVACTPENISRLDPDLPVVQRALDKIKELNPLQREGTPDPLPSMIATAPDSPASPLPETAIATTST